MRKINGVLYTLLLSIGLVSADELSSGLSKGMNQVLSAVQALLGPFFGAILGGGGEVLFQKVLFLAIILVTVYIIIEKMPVFKDNKIVIWIITISVSLLSTRFMTPDLLKTMLLPYTVLGVAITSLLPLMIFFAFALKQGKTLRKVMWMFFGVTFLVIWSVRYDGLGIASWIYFGTAMVAFFMFLFDGTIRRLMIKNKFEQYSYTDRHNHLVEIRKALETLNKDEHHYSDKKVFEVQRKQLERKLRELERKVLKP